AQMAAHLAYGAKLASYRFDHYRTKLKPEQKPSLTGVVLLSRVSSEAKRAYGPLEKIVEGIEFTKDLVTEPGNIIYPETLARRAQDLEARRVEVEILGETEMRQLGMGALLGVGLGSERESQLLVMRW